MLHVFTESEKVSRMYCSISRMARLCRVNSPSFCRGDTSRALSLCTPEPCLPKGKRGKGGDVAPWPPFLSTLLGSYQALSQPLRRHTKA